MPVVRFHLADDQYSTTQVQRLLTSASQAYSHLLDSPVQRVRAFARLYAPELCVVAGEPVSEGGPPAPYFELIVLSGRPVEQRQMLLRSFTDLIVEHLGADRELVRGRAIEVAPEDWSIAGEPASVRRRDEIAARAATR